MLTALAYKTMPHKDTSSDPALDTSVAILRDGIGPTVSGAFVIAPLWVPDIGCVGLITFANVPYAQVRVSRRRQAGGKLATSRAASRCFYEVGAGVVEFARRVGLAVGPAVYRVRKSTLIADIKVEDKFSGHFGDDVKEERRITSPSPEKGSRREAPTTRRNRQGHVVNMEHIIQ